MKQRCFPLIFLALLITALSACTTGEPPIHSAASMPIPTSGSMTEFIEVPNPVNDEKSKIISCYEILYLFNETPEQQKLRNMVRASFENKSQKDLFIRDYLTERGMYKDEPDGIYSYGDYSADYYCNEEQEKYSFILTIDLSADEFYEYVYCITFSQNDLQKIGNILYEYDDNHHMVSKEVYTAEDLCAAYAAFEYLDGIPLPFVKDFYIEYTELEKSYLYDDVFHMNQRFWLDKALVITDETERVVGYNADLFYWQNAYLGTIYNDFIYDEKGRLTAIKEAFSEQERDTDFWDYVTDISLEYRENGTLSTIDYGFYYMDYNTHFRGTGDSTGKIFYDENGRMIYRKYYMTHGLHSCFYLYEGASKSPWAYIELGGLAQWGDDVSEYGFGVSVYLFQSPVDEIENDRQLWQDAYAEFVRENMQADPIDLNTLTEGSAQEARFMAFSSGGYPVTPFFYLYDIDQDGIPELIHTDAAKGYESDVYTYKNQTASKIGSIKFYPFGGLFLPPNKGEGLYSDMGYKRQYGEIYFYTVESDLLTEQMVLEYNNQREQFPLQSGLPYVFNNYTEMEYCQATEVNIEKVIYG